MKRMLGWLLMMCLVVACSDPDQGPPLGPFAAITKTETDAPFNIVPPSSKSPAGFTYTSSNPAVATISGSLVTIKGPGTSTITAAQPSIGGWGPTSASTTLTVAAVPCESGSTRVNGVCTVVPNCVPPAVPTNNQCVPPPTGAMLIHFNGLAWAGVSNSNTWTSARDFCASVTIDGASGWRQPSSAELMALQASGAMIGDGWSLGPTWSSTIATNAATPSHLVVDLSTATGAALERSDAAGAWVSSVR